MAEDRRKKYDLEDRTFEFARRVRAFVAKLPRTTSNLEDISQVVPMLAGTAATTARERMSDCFMESFLRGFGITSRGARSVA